MIVVAVIVSVAICTGFGVFAYCHSKRERLVRPPCMPRRVYPPPVGPDESQTVIYRAGRNDWTLAIVLCINNNYASNHLFVIILDTSYCRNDSLGHVLII